MIRTLYNFSDVEYVTQEPLIFDSLESLIPYRPFSVESLLFLQEIGVRILRDKRARSYPDLIAFAFWSSRSNLNQIRNGLNVDHFPIGRGVVFHVTPGNVPMNFAYSLATGLLTGNINIVKVSSRTFDQVDIFIEHLNLVLEDPSYSIWRRRIFLLRYGHIREINDVLSSMCDVRIIWGGDKSVNEIRKSPLKPKSYDLVFADRFSFCAIKSTEYLSSLSKERIATNFYNDSYLLDQNACTSPHLIVWIGDSDINLSARKIFRDHLSRLTKTKFQMMPFQSSAKITAAYRAAANNRGSRIDANQDGTIVSVVFNNLPVNIEDLRSNSGFFLEVSLASLTDLVPVVTRNFQTMSQYGFDHDELSDFLSQNDLLGIDRVVPIGKTLDFSFFWDGYNLMSMLSRQVVLSQDNFV